MLKQMMAEIIFRNPGDMNPAIADLIGFDFEVRVLDDWIDDDGPAVWIVATTLSGLSQSAFSFSESHCRAAGRRRRGSRPGP